MNVLKSLGLAAAIIRKPFPLPIPLPLPLRLALPVTAVVVGCALAKAVESLAGQD